MKFRSRTAVLAATFALSIAPAAALATPGNGNGQGGDHTPNGKAYGKLCQDQSHKHVAGEKGTPFSQCVKAMAQLDKGKTDNPSKACADLSKKHVEGEKGTPFSQCVAAGAKLLGQDG